MPPPQSCWVMPKACKVTTLSYPTMHTRFLQCTLEDTSINFFEGIYPKLVIVGLVDHAAYSGAYNLCPFNFQHFNVSKCELTSNGQSIPSTPYRPNFKAKLTAREYFNMFQQLSHGGMFADDNGITYRDWANGTTLYTFNLAPDLAITGHAQAVRYTNININLSFATAAPKNLQLIALAVYDTQLELTGSGNWLLDPTQQPN